MDALQSANLKLIRADEHIKSIKRCVRSYARRKPHKVIVDAQGEDTAEIRTSALLDDISVIAGEAIYQLRSALDHLTFDLVKLNRVRTPLPKNWDEKCDFPLWLKVPKITPVYNCFKHLPNISKPAFAFLESVQPYHAIGMNVGRISTPKVLGWIAKLSNVDKHRHLNVVDPTLIHRETLRTARGTISIARSRIKHGTKIKHVPAQPYPTVDVKSRFTVYVAFKERDVGDDALFSVQEVLQFCVQTIEDDIIPAFRKLL